MNTDQRSNVRKLVAKAWGALPPLRGASWGAANDKLLAEAAKYERAHRDTFAGSTWATTTTEAARQWLVTCMAKQLNDARSPTWEEVLNAPPHVMKARALTAANWGDILNGWRAAGLDAEVLAKLDHADYCGREG